MAEKQVFDVLSSVDVSNHIEKLQTGKTTLSYLSWSWAWAEVKKRYPDADYKVLKFTDGLPYVVSDMGIMVYTQVSIQGICHEMWLPVMDGANNAMKTTRYSYQVKEYSGGKWTGKFVDKWVEPATMFDINKTIMRCLTKNLAMFGLGLYIYSGEDLPEVADSVVNDVMGQIQSCDSVDKLMAIWNNNKAMQSNAEFKTALGNRKKELESTSPQH